jgi:hypothetical protein
MYALTECTNILFWYLAWWWLNEPKHVAEFLILIKIHVVFIDWINYYTTGSVLVKSPLSYGIRRFTIFCVIFWPCACINCITIATVNTRRRRFILRHTACMFRLVSAIRSYTASSIFHTILYDYGGWPKHAGSLSVNKSISRGLLC